MSISIQNIDQDLPQFVFYSGQMEELKNEQTVAFVLIDSDWVAATRDSLKSVFCPNLTFVAALLSLRLLRVIT